MDELKVYRRYQFSEIRSANAWWDCKLKDGIWHVHFHADYVPSTDWTCSTDNVLDNCGENLFTLINSEHEHWKMRVDAHWKKMRTSERFV